MIRDVSFLKTVPEDQQHHFIDEHPLAPYKLKTLKKYIQAKFQKSSRFHVYNCEYSGLDKETNMPRFKGLEESFAPTVMQFFQTRIAAQYPLIDEKKQDPFEEANTQHSSFMKMAAERVVGRDVLINEVCEPKNVELHVHSYYCHSLVCRVLCQNYRQNQSCDYLRRTWLGKNVDYGCIC